MDVFPRILRNFLKHISKNLRKVASEKTNVNLNLTEYFKSIKISAVKVLCMKFVKTVNWLIEIFVAIC